MSILLLMDDDGLLSPPSGFGYTPPFQIYQDGSTSWRFDSLYDAINPLDITDYYVSPTGSNSNSGLTPLLPKRGIGLTIVAARSAPTAWVRINVAAGDYPHNSQTSTITSFAKNLIIKASGAARTGSFIQGAALSWSLISGTTYSTSRSSVNFVLDDSVLDANGDYFQYAKVASQAACEATPKTWFQSGSTVYVNTNGAAPGANVLTCIGAVNAQFNLIDKTVIIDGSSGGLSFVGGINYCLDLLASGPNNKFYARNVRYSFCPGNGLSIRGSSIALSDTCTASVCGLDGFNYHVDTSLAYLPTAIEIGVVSRDHGFAGGGSNNASTMHDGGTIVRVKGRYSKSAGSVVIDVNDGTQSWNVLCDARDSTLGTGSGIDASWCVFTGTAKMWLDRCTYGAGASTSEYDLSVDAGCTMYLRGTPEGNSSVAGTLTTY